ncbi:MAG: hypothetical protein KF726_10040 [Anaerolineae bacterium]|nr:hypothetical protein [Anaerolineae bacterium]
MDIDTGTDMARESFDVTLMSGDLRWLSWATMNVIRQNLMWVFGYNVVLIPIAVDILATATSAPELPRKLNPILATFALAFSSMSIVSNSLRLKKRHLQSPLNSHANI